MSALEVIENQYIEKLRKKIKLKEEIKKTIYFSGNNSPKTKYQNSSNDSGITSIAKGEYEKDNVSHFLCECKNPEKKKCTNCRQNSFSTFSSSQIDK